MTFRELIDKIGVDRLARAFDTDESHVRVMKSRNSIPPVYWGILIEEAASACIRGVTHKKLTMLRGERFAREDVA
jgi:hypothetical protein